MDKVIEEGFLVDLGRINGEETHRYLTFSPHLVFPEKEKAQFYVDFFKENQPRQSYPNAKVIKVKIMEET